MTENNRFITNEDEIIIPKGTDIPRFAWQHLRRFRNKDVYAEHKLKWLERCKLFDEGQPLAQRERVDIMKDLQRQGDDVRHTLLQAEEYYNAARNASLATQPTMLYYCTMHLALAEILYKDASCELTLAQMRLEKNGHGLTGHNKWLVDIGNVYKTDKKAKNPKSQYTKTPWKYEEYKAISIKERFEKISKNLTVSITGGTFTHWQENIFSAPWLIECEQLGKFSLPVKKWIKYMRYDDIYVCKFKSGNILNIFKLLIENSIYNDSLLFKIKRIGKFNESSQIHESYLMGRYNIAEKAEKLIDNELLKIPNNPYEKTNYGTYRANIPLYFPNILISNDYNLTFIHEEFYSEHQLYYVAVYILGMFARYYPDWWMREVEEYSLFAHYSEILLNQAFERIPLLALSALSDSYHVLDA